MREHSASGINFHRHLTMVGEPSQSSRDKAQAEAARNYPPGMFEHKHVPDRAPSLGERLMINRLDRIPLPKRKEFEQRTDYYAEAERAKAIIASRTA